MKKILLLMFCFFFISTNTLYAADKPKTWTMLIFLNGNNNLDEFATENILEMEKVGSNDQVNVVVQWASAENGGKSKRMLIKKSNDPKHPTSPVIQDLGRVDMGDYRNLEDFIAWGVKNYPADHYFVDVWNHGSGWHRSMQKNKSPAHAMDISWDDFTAHAITTKELGETLAYAAKVIGHKVDIYGSDACLMAMAEIADEMKDSVSYFVGSQEVEPGEGWPYEDFLSRWQAIPSATPAQVASTLVDAYVKSYEGGSNGKSEVTFSAYDLSKLPAFNNAVSLLAKNIISLNAEDRHKVLVAAEQDLGFEGDYGDFIDFVEALQAAKISGLDKEVLAQVRAASADLIIANEDTPEYAKAKGLSIWLPTSKYIYAEYINLYHEMNFDKDTQWGNAVGAFL